LAATENFSATTSDERGERARAASDLLASVEPRSMSMKAIVPVAGIGTRLRPHTHTAPKVLLQVAGKPILAHILDELVTLGIREITFVVGHMGDMIRQFVAENYKIKANYVTQDEPLGLGHAIYLTRELHFEDPAVLIILGDTIFRADLKSVLKKPVSRHGRPESQLGVKKVDDPRRFGVVEMRGPYVVRLREKPKRPKTNLAIVGIYLIRNPRLLFSCLDEVIAKGIQVKGEYQLTSALQRMLEKGERMRIFPVQGWYDCGKTETLLSTNRVLLDIQCAKAPRNCHTWFPDSIINLPISIARSAKIHNSIIGPYVSIAEGAEIHNAIVTNAILGKNSIVKDIVLGGSIVSDNAKVQGHYYSLNVGDSSEVNIGH
jgi:glucose-1-phosphate thymidylyltransferase